jgi:hypothetical protein
MSVPPADQQPTGNPKQSLHWLTNFPSDTDIEKFILATERSAAVGRACVKEARASQEALERAKDRGALFSLDCQQRIRDRNVTLASYHTAVTRLRQQAGF